MYFYHQRKDGGVNYRCRKFNWKAEEEVLSFAMQEALSKVIINPEVLIPREEHYGARLVGLCKLLAKTI